jgi:hypothetical protein
MGVVTCPEVRSDAAIVAISLPSSCRNFLLQLLHELVRCVVVLDVAGSNPIAHPQYFRTPSDPGCPLRLGCLAYPLSDFESELSDFGSRSAGAEDLGRVRTLKSRSALVLWLITGRGLPGRKEPLT